MLFLRIGVTTFYLLLTLYAIGRPLEIWLDSFYQGQRGPYLQSLTSQGVTIRWQSEMAYQGSVYFGEQPDKLNRKQEESSVSEIHQVVLQGLKPATQYYYQLASKDKKISHHQQNWFITAPEVGTNVATRFWVTGDQGYAGKIQSDVRDAMWQWLKQNPRSDVLNTKGVDFWLSTGDSAYRSGSNKQFQQGLFNPYKDILRNTTFWPVHGNHDSRRKVFYDLFTLPVNGESGGTASGSERYYSFDYAQAHFVILDTQLGDLDADSLMLNWLRVDLAETKQRWLIVLFHHPVYTKGTHNSDDNRDSGGRMNTIRQNIIPVLEKHGVDLVLSGHSHMYERSDLINCHYGSSQSLEKNMIRQVANKTSDKKTYQKYSTMLAPYEGTIYAVVGSSSKLDRGDLNHPAMPYSMHEAGSMVVDIEDNRLIARFINDKGEIKDRFEIHKGIKKGVQSRLCTP